MIGRRELDFGDIVASVFLVDDTKSMRAAIGALAFARRGFASVSFVLDPTRSADLLVGVVIGLEGREAIAAPLDVSEAALIGKNIDPAVVPTAGTEAHVKVSGGALNADVNTRMVLDARIRCGQSLADHSIGAVGVGNNRAARKKQSDAQWGKG